MKSVKTKKLGIVHFFLLTTIGLSIVLIGYYFYQSTKNYQTAKPQSSTENYPALITLTPANSPTPTKVSVLDENEYFKGKISPQVPYSGLKFKEIDIHNLEPLLASLDKTDYHEGEYVYDGYTFIASEGEDFEFLAEEGRSSNPGSFIGTELYGWGPTIIKMDTRIGWGVPATTRYFYVVIGSDRYGPGYVVPDGSGRTFDGSKYGNYTLKITQRK